jgi:23S rRNA G2069 N7-methylase RlmK/C1962 C5-methylase RlmI
MRNCSKSFCLVTPTTSHVSKRTLERPVGKTPSNFGDSVRQAILPRENDARFRRTLVDNKKLVFYSGQRWRYEFGS